MTTTAQSGSGSLRNLARRFLPVAPLALFAVIVGAAGTRQSDREPDEIRVSVDADGTVRLRGTVREEAIRRLAGELARAAAPSLSIRNELVVEPRAGSELVRRSLREHRVIEPPVTELSSDPSRVGAPAPGARATCVLSHPSQASWCFESVPLRPGTTALDVCEEVLHCLEDPRCVALHCGASELRGGWQLELVAGVETSDRR